MKTTLKLSGAVAVLCITTIGCTGSKESTRPDDVKVGGPTVAKPSGTKPGGSQTASTPAETGPQQPQISKRAQLYFEDAVKLYETQKKAGSYDYAVLEKKFQAAVNEDPNLAEAEYDLGVLAEKQGKTKEAVGHYQAALKTRPTLKQAAENLAVIMQNDGDVGGAVEIYKKILTNFPDDGSARARLAEIYLQQGDHDRAMELAREALIREPKTLTAYKVMMRSNLERGQLSMARLVALRAMKLDENDPELYFTVGQILAKEGEREKAMLQFKKAVEVAPNFLPAHVILAKLALDTEDYSGAEEHIRHILQADSKNAAAHVDLGVAYKGMGQYDKALQEYETAEKLDPELPSIYLNKGVILARHKDAPEKGIELYKKYIAMSGGVGVDNASKLIDEAQNVIKAKEDEKRALEEAKKMEEEQKKADEEAKRVEEQQKRDAAKDQMAKDAAGAGDTKPAAADKKGDVKPAADKGAKPEEKKPETKVEEKKPAPAPTPAATPAAPAPAPAKKKSSDEPGDEPSDNL